MITISRLEYSRTSNLSVKSLLSSIDKACIALSEINNYLLHFYIAIYPHIYVWGNVRNYIKIYYLIIWDRSNGKAKIPKY